MNNSVYFNDACKWINNAKSPLALGAMRSTIKSPISGWNNKDKKALLALVKERAKCPTIEVPDVDFPDDIEFNEIVFIGGTIDYPVN